jgi:hypothetical protein
MGKVWRIALSATLLLAVPRPAKAVEHTMPILPPVGDHSQPSQPTNGLAMENVAPPLPAAPEASQIIPGGAQPSSLVQFFSGHWHSPAFPPAAGAPCSTCCTDGNCGDNCGKRQRKIARFLDWMIYRPLDGGKTKCCHGCDSEPPPAWAFFPCEKGCRCGGGCAVAGQATMYYAKDAGPENKVVQTAYPPVAAPQPMEPPPAPKPVAAPPKQQGIAKSMPVLDPTQYRRKPGGN